MIGLVDYHMHTLLSDGKNTHEEMIQEAILKGLDEAGFSDHVCLKGAEWSINPVDIPVMSSHLSALKSQYTDQIVVRYGIEMDYFPGEEVNLKKLINSIPLDYVIGSVHFIGNWNFDSDLSLYGKWSNDTLYSKYFKLIQQAASSGLFDIIGHLDIIKNFGVYPETDLSNLFEETIQIIAKNNLVIELNTSGADRPCGEFTPGRMLLELCHHYNVGITLGSDAHSATQIARHYESAVELLQQIGYTEIITFDQRQKGKIRL